MMTIFICIHVHTDFCFFSGLTTVMSFVGIWYFLFFFFVDFVDIYVEDQPIDSKPMRMNFP